MFEKFIPLSDRVLVKRFETEETTVSGIIIPDTAQERPQRGTVIAVGAGKKGLSCDIIRPTVNIGDIVYLSKYSGIELGQDYIIVREEEILGIYEQ